MRFGAPRSSSPSPIRGQFRHSTYGLRSDDDTDSDAFSDSDSSDGFLSSSSSEDNYVSDSQYEPGPRKSLFRSMRSPEEQRQLDETIASIRLRTRHHDPYEEWEKRTRKEAFVAARKGQSVNNSDFHEWQAQVHREEAKRQAAQHDQEMAAVQAKLNNLRLSQQQEEKKLRDEWEIRQKRLWSRIETVIRQEEEKVARRLAEEQKKREEEERQRRDEEQKRQLAEERLREETERRRREEEEQRRLEEEKKQKEEEEERLREEEERRKRERLDAERQQRQQVGLTTAEDDWRAARANLKRLKSEMAAVKADKPLKAEWGKWRRQIKPKIGQLTNDSASIDRISQELIAIIQPPAGPHHPKIYLAILSSLAKDILLQAEIEITAEKNSAGPLAQVTFTVLANISDFAEVFFAKLVQRVGGWPIPYVVPNKDFDGREWANREERLKVMGFRKSGNGDGFESESDFTSRVAGIMRIYFSVLKVVPQRGPLKPMFQLPRYWTWFARLLGERVLLETAVAAQLMYTALDVMGHDALGIWGAQWVKMLALVYDGVTVGIGVDKYIGGTSPEGKAARVRVQLEIERIMSAP